MKITVRCYFIPADITFDTGDVRSTAKWDKNGIVIIFDDDEDIVVDKEHYLTEKAKNQVS